MSIDYPRCKHGNLPPCPLCDCGPAHFAVAILLTLAGCATPDCDREIDDVGGYERCEARQGS